MSYFDSYQRKAIAPGYVDKEGDYELSIVAIKQGKLETGERFTQVECEINYKNNPHINLFLTEGRNFDGNFTAFIDTFGIQPGEQSWIGKRGYVHILLSKKDGFTNMKSRWILGDDGFVLPEVKAAANGGAPVIPQQVQQVAQAFDGAITEGESFESIAF